MNCRLSSGALTLIGFLGLFGTLAYMVIQTTRTTPEERGYNFELFDSGKVENVVRVVMHNTYSYTIFMQDGVDLRPFKIEFSHFDYWNRVDQFKKPKVLADVPSDEPMWVLWEHYRTKKEGYKGPCFYTTFELHVHDPQDIDHD